MYLKDVFLENIASIKCFDFQPQFNKDGSPKPIILVGINGSGKSIFLSYIVDALIEFLSLTGFDRNNISSLKINHDKSKRLDSESSICLLEFKNNLVKVDYCYDIDNLPKEQYFWSGKIETVWEQIRFNNILNHLSNYPQNNDSSLIKSEKIFISLTKEIFQENIRKEIFKELHSKNIYCYFPSNRQEIPHWIDQSYINDLNEKNIKQPINIETSAKENKSLLSKIFIISKLSEIVIKGKQKKYSFELKNEKINIEFFFKKILNNENVELYIESIEDYQKILDSNTSIKQILEEEEIFIPNIDHLSTGQSTLFNLFITIIRYAIKENINQGIESKKIEIKLEQIEGIVLIDDIDIHLHPELQYKVLPTLLKLFPKVQFIVTTHSPLFILGMEKEYGENGFQIIEMPDGNQITPERFSQFQASFDYYKKTKKFEEEIKQTIESQTKPLILTEGPTDVDYIKQALIFLQEENENEDILNQLEIDSVGGVNERGEQLDGGIPGLKAVSKVLKNNPRFMKNKVLLLYDCECQPATILKGEGNLRVEIIPKVERGLEEYKVQSKGIENLFPTEVLEQYDDWKTIRNYTRYNKRRLCDWICSRQIKADFKNFDRVIKIIKEFLETPVIDN